MHHTNPYISKVSHIYTSNLPKHIVRSNPHNRSIDIHNLVNKDLLVKLIGVVVFPLISGNTHIGFRSSVLGCFRWYFGSQSVGTAGKDRKQHRKARYTTTT